MRAKQLEYNLLVLIRAAFGIEEALLQRLISEDVEFDSRSLARVACNHSDLVASPLQCISLEIVGSAIGRVNDGFDGHSIHLQHDTSLDGLYTHIAHFELASERPRKRRYSN